MSRFVSGGTNDAPTERDEAWLKAQQEIEAKRLQKVEMGKQQDGKSLYETLQANKAAKQEAFEESIKLRNQFQTLNEDEVEFLDSVMESTRKKDEAVRKQTREELEAFKRQQEEAEKAARDSGEPEAVETTSWAVGRKRKKGKEDILGGVKLRKGSSAGDKAGGEAAKKASEKSDQSGEVKGPERATGEGSGDAADVKRGSTKDSTVAKETSEEPPKVLPAGLGLGAYSSDEDD